MADEEPPTSSDLQESADPEGDALKALDQAVRAEAEQLGRLDLFPRLREIREELGLSQATVARAVGTTQQTIDRIEKGKVQHSRYIEKIIKAYRAQGMFLTPASAEVARLLGNQWSAYPTGRLRIPPDYINRDPELDLIIDHAYPHGHDYGRLENRSRLDRSTRDTFFPPEQQVENTGLSSPAIDFNNIQDGIPVLQIDIHGRVLKRPVEFVKPPQFLEFVRGVYALRVPDNEMSPVLKAGDLVFINPTIPPKPGNEMLITSTDDDGSIRGLFRTLISETPNQLVVRSWNPIENKSIRPSDWPTRHVVVANYYRT